MIFWCRSRNHSYSSDTLLFRFSRKAMATSSRSIVAACTAVPWRISLVHTGYERSWYLLKIEPTFYLFLAVVASRFSCPLHCKLYRRQTKHQLHGRRRRRPSGPVLDHLWIHSRQPLIYWYSTRPMAGHSFLQSSRVSNTLPGVGFL